MEQLWTPWRMRFITAARSENGCIFCDLPRDPSASHHIVQRGSSAFVILNLYPYTLGHLMVVPYRHLGRFGQTSRDERREIGALLRRSEAIVRRALSADRVHVGINLGRAGGAGIEGHVHVHLVPRYRGGASAEGSEPDLEDAFARLSQAFTSEEVGR